MLDNSFHRIISPFVIICCAFLFSSGCSWQVVPLVESESNLEHGVIVVSVTQEDGFQIITARVPYVGIEGDDKTGLARLVIPIKALKSAGQLPAFCHVHYEKDVGGAKKWAKRGWIVSTAVYTPPEGESPIDPALGNGYNLARAILQWVRRLPIVDASRILVDGASQGGYMALAMGADQFPVIAIVADVPVVNWAYNFAYFEANRQIAGFGKRMEETPLPGLASVIGLADMCYAYFTQDLQDEVWYLLSPISYLHLITSPVLVTCATGDMLVPIEQMTRKHIRPFDPSTFPEGFTRDFDSLPFCQKAKKVFEEILPETQVEIFVVPPQKDSYELTREMFIDSKRKPKRRPKNMDKPWSKTKQWSLVYLDEGAPSAVAGHTKLEWSISPDSFVEHHRSASLPVSVLTLEKLNYLLQRYSGELDTVITMKNNKVANRLNYQNIEQLDVLLSLWTYASMSPQHEEHLKTLYSEVPVKPFGSEISAMRIKEELDKYPVRIKNGSIQ